MSFSTDTNVATALNNVVTYFCEELTQQKLRYIKENVTKLDKIKKAAIPLFCPKCKQVMNKQLYLLQHLVTHETRC